MHQASLASLLLGLAKVGHGETEEFLFYRYIHEVLAIPTL